MKLLIAVKQACRVAFSSGKRDRSFGSPTPFRWVIHNVWMMLVCLVSCAWVEEEGVWERAAPVADREFWEATFELHRPGVQLSIQAAYVAEDLTRQEARADSGVQVVFRSPDRQSRTVAHAQRLTLASQAERVTLGGQIVLWVADSLEVQADTLVWEGKEERLSIPGRVRISGASGWTRGQQLQTDFAFEAWTMEAVNSLWRGNDAAGEYEVIVRAQREQGRRDGAVEIVYDSVEVEYEGTLMSGPRAHFSEAESQMYFPGGLSGADSSRQFTAGEALFSLAEQHMQAGGGVEFSEPDDGPNGRGFRLTAAVVEESRSRGEFKAQGQPASFVQGARRIEAEVLTYARQEKVLEATGQVDFREGERHLKAARLVYKSGSAELRAETDVVLEVAEFTGQIRCGRLYLDLQQERGTLEDQPVLRRLTTDEKRLEFRAGVMHFDLQTSTLKGMDGFAVEAEDLHLRAARGSYQATIERLTLAERVVLLQERATAEWRSRLEADSLIVQLEEGKIVRLDVPTGLSGMIESAGGRTSWLAGDEGSLFWVDGRLERFELTGNAEVTSRDVELDEANRFRGGRVTLYFTGDDLSRAWVGDSAELWSRLAGVEEGEKTGIMHVQGAELEIRFTQGRSIEWQMGPQVEGRFVPQDDKINREPGDHGAQD